MDSRKHDHQVKYKNMDGYYKRRPISREALSRVAVPAKQGLHGAADRGEAITQKHRRNRLKLPVVHLQLRHTKLPHIGKRLKALAMLSILITGTAVMLLSSAAQAIVSLRGTNSASIGDQIVFSGGSAATGTSSGNTGSSATTSVGATMPTGVKQGDVMVAAITVTGGTGVTFNVPSGWTLLQRQNSTTALGQGLYWKQAGAGESGSYFWTWTGNQKASIVIMAYTNVDSSTPIDNSAGQANASNAVETTPGFGVTGTAVANEMLVGFFGEANSATYTATSMTTLEKQDASAGGGATSRTGTMAADTQQGAAGTLITAQTGTTGTTASVSVGQLVTIKPNTAAASLTLSNPTGTVQNDVILASISISGGSAVTFTAPSGWTSIQNTNTAGNEIKTQSWYKVAGASEPSTYTWSWTGNQRAVGVIFSYANVDTSSPIDTSGSQANTSSTTITAPSITPTGSADVLVGFFGVANSSTITSTLTDETYATIKGTSSLASIRGADTQLSASGATGTKTATAGTAGVSVGQLVALTPAVANLTQASHRWFSDTTPQAGIGWVAHTDAVDNNWVAAAYGNNLFVAISNNGTGNRVMTSPDGITWTARTSAANSSCHSIAYGNGIFTVVSNGLEGSASEVMTSPDGITWTLRTAASNNAWNGVAYGNGLFVAVSDVSTGTINDRVMTSPDGITWTSRTAANNLNWYATTYGNGLFVAVSQGGTGNRVMTSPDGITWTARTSAVDNNWTSITYGNGLFAAVSYDGTGNGVMTSPDGITWTSRTPAADNQWNSIRYGAGLFVAVSTTGTGNRVMTSPNGITWTARTSAADNNWWGLTYGNGTFVAVAGSGSGIRVMTSESLVPPTASTWTSRSMSPGSGVAVAYGNGTFVSVSAGQTGVVRTSTDGGITWTAHDASANSQWDSITYGNGLFVAVSCGDTVTFGCNTSAATRVMTSPDGITWTSRTASSNTSWYSVTYGNGLFVAVAQAASTADIMTSPDGITWTARTAPNTNGWASVTYGNGMYVAVAATGTTTAIMTSPTGTTWTARTAPASGQLWSAVTYGNGLFVSVSQAGTGNRVMTSPDGITWTVRTSAADSCWLSMAYGGNLFVAVSCGSEATSQEVMTSPDGINWTLRTAAAAHGWASTAYGNGLFLAISAGDVMTAPLIDGAVGDTLAAQDTALTDTTSDAVRLRMNIGVNAGSSSYPLKTSDARKFALQYGLRTGGSCTGSETYYDVGIAPWTARTAAASNLWVSATYGNGLFVAVSISGTGNRVMTSPDGITWTSRTSAADIGWQNVTYGNGLFVAVAQNGAGNRVMTSPDGITWTLRAPSANNAWSGLTYGNGLFVAVTGFLGTTSGEVMTSPDGINWTSRASAVDLGWNKVGYGNGLFVAVSTTGTGNRVMTSPDGITWTSRTSAADKNWQAATYGNGLFVSVSNGGTNQVMTMSPPVNWGGVLSNNYGTVTSSGSDPTQGGSTILAENYITNNYFTAPADVAVGQYGQWDFGLDLSKGAYQSAYCFRVTNSNGSTINTYSTYPEVMRCTVPPNNLRMRTGKAFCNGVKRYYWSRSGA
jgi:hypothetical protein